MRNDAWMHALEQQERAEHEAVQGFADLVARVGLAAALQKLFFEQASRVNQEYHRLKRTEMPISDETDVQDNQEF